MNGADFTKRQRITLGMKTKEASKAMDEWLYRQAPCDMMVRRAKDKDGAGLIWASWCVQNLDGVKVDIKDI